MAAMGNRKHSANRQMPAKQVQSERQRGRALNGITGAAFLDDLAPAGIVLSLISSAARSPMALPGGLSAQL
jgi:hypothetical protein